MNIGLPKQNSGISPLKQSSTQLKSIIIECLSLESLPLQAKTQQNNSPHQPSPYSLHHLHT